MFGEISFPGKHDDEQIILLLRRHWFVFFVHMLSVLGAIAGLVFLYILFTFASNDLAPIDRNLLLFGESLGTLFVWNLFFILWLDFYLDAWIVTNERIINIDQKGFFNREISELKLTKIQDVTSEIIGVIPTLLDFGNIYVQTAGEKERFDFYQIPKPNEVKNAIVRLQEKGRRKEEREMGKAMRGEI